MSQAVAPTFADRLLASFRALVRAEFPQLTYVGVYEYTITGSASSSIECRPTDTTIPLPALSKVTLLPSVLGESVAPPSSGSCLIAFVNADPTRPVCISITSPSKTATVDATQSMSIGPSASSVSIAGGAIPAARAGDMAGIFPIVTTQVKVLV